MSKRHAYTTFFLLQELCYKYLTGCHQWPVFKHDSLHIQYMYMMLFLNYIMFRNKVLLLFFFGHIKAKIRCKIKKKSTAQTAQNITVCLHATTLVTSRPYLSY